MLRYETTAELMQWLDAGVSPYHAVEKAKEVLRAAGFAEKEAAEPFGTVRPGDAFYVSLGSFLAAFTVEEGDVLRVAAAHTDWPCLRIKPNPELVNASGLCRLSVEPYGGAILNSWLDRPLGLAGAVLLRGESPMHPIRRTVCWEEGVLVIPHVAIHMNRKVNEGVEMRANVDMLPICRTAEKAWEKDGYLIGKLASRLKVRTEDILSFELCAYCRQKAETVGFERDLLVSPRLDNLTSAQAVVRGLIAARGASESGIHAAVLYDNEEIGSNTRRGADSATLSVLLEKLAFALGRDRMWLADAAARGMLLSCDAAHAVHPNHPEYADFSCAPVLGRGVALKRSPRYSSTAETCAVIYDLCRTYDIPLQTYMNRADLPGGSTVGSMASALLGMPAADVGVPILAMHSACETMGLADQDAFVRLTERFFAEK